MRQNAFFVGAPFDKLRDRTRCIAYKIKAPFDMIRPFDKLRGIQLITSSRTAPDEMQIN
ncbi:MAG: hypothetical protein RLZZ198_1331 [Bacteroidota bacterium]|jgi:hypothetical protein